MSAANEWLNEVATLDHRARMQRSVALGRAADQGDAAASEQVAALLASEDAYCRSLALASSFGSSDGALVLAALEDPSRCLRRRASKRVAPTCDDARAGAALAALPRGRPRTALCMRLARGGRFAAVEALLSQQLAEPVPDGRTLDLIAFASESFVRAELSRSLGSLGPDGMRRLATWHPACVADHMAQEVKRRGTSDLRLRNQLGNLLAPLCKRAPVPALALLETLMTTGDEPKHWLAAALRELLRHEPQATFDLLRRLHESARPVLPPGSFGLVRFDKVVHRLGDERLKYLIENAYSTLSDGNKARRWFLRLPQPQQSIVIEAFLASGRGRWGGFLFRHMPKEGAKQKQRARAYKRWSTAAQDTHGVIAHGLLESLPDDLRQHEARRHLDDVAYLATRAPERMRYARYLRFEEAKAALSPWLGHPEGEVRADALRSLLAVPQFHPVDTGPAVNSILERKFEQDPVRLAMFETLAALPPRCFSSALTEALGRAIQDALDAADLSTATSAAIERLVVRLFRVDPAWGASWLSKLLRLRGNLSSFGLAQGLLPNEVEALSPAIATLCEQWANKERASALVWLAMGFGKRLKHLPPLLAALERLATELPFVLVAHSALGLLRTHAPERFVKLVPSLLAADPSFVFLPSVAYHLSTRRQDLLAPVLDSKPMRGRFASGRTHWVVHFDAGFGTWTAAQQTAHAAALTTVLQDDERDVPTLRAAIGTLAQLSFAPRNALLPFAADPRPPVREMVIRALPKLDGDVALPVLIECLDDDRARYAIYSLRKVLSEMQPPEVVSRLQSVSMKKVTVAKEVIRLLGELAGAPGYAALLAYDRKELHRDVRIALLRALWDHLHHEATWSVFEEALADPDWVVASRITEIPLGRLSEDQERRITHLIVRLLERPEPEARLALLQRAAFLPLRDSDRVLYQACLTRVQTGKEDEAGIALTAVLRRMRPEEASSVVALLTSLFSDRRRLRALLQILPNHLGPYAPKHVSDVGKKLTAAMAADPLLAPQRVELAGALFRPRRVDRALRRAFRAASVALRHHDGRHRRHQTQRASEPARSRARRARRRTLASARSRSPRRGEPSEARLEQRAPGTPCAIPSRPRPPRGRSRRIRLPPRASKVATASPRCYDERHSRQPCALPPTHALAHARSLARALSRARARARFFSCCRLSV
jgi:hypothetical protein